MSIDEIEPTYWYRIEDTTYAAPLDEDERPLTGRTEVGMRRYKVVKTTPKGVWLQLYEFAEGDLKRFVRLGAHKRWACPSPEEAIVSYKARKLRQIVIGQAKVARARVCLASPIIEQWSGQKRPAVNTKEDPVLVEYFASGA